MPNTEQMNPMSSPASSSLTPQPPTVVAPVVGRPREVINVQNQMIDVMDTGKFEQIQRIAGLMAYSSLTPKHLKGASREETSANCFRVINQALRWGMDPFAVVDETYMV